MWAGGKDLLLLGRGPGIGESIPESELEGIFGMILCLLFTDGDTEAQAGRVTCPRSHVWSGCPLYLGPLLTPSPELFLWCLQASWLTTLSWDPQDDEGYGLGTWTGAGAGGLLTR